MENVNEETKFEEDSMLRPMPTNFSLVLDAQEDEGTKELSPHDIWTQYRGRSTATPTKEEEDREDDNDNLPIRALNNDYISPDGRVSRHSNFKNSHSLFYS